MPCASGGHESAHWSRHLWDHFRSTRAHVDRMYRAFGILAKGSRASAEPPYIEHSNPEPDPGVPAIRTERSAGRAAQLAAEPGPELEAGG